MKTNKCLKINEGGVTRCKTTHIEWVTNEVLLHSTGSCIQHSGINYNGKYYEKEYINTHICVCELNRSIMSDSLQSHGLQPARLLCPWDFLGKTTGVGCLFFLKGIFLP